MKLDINTIYFLEFFLQANYRAKVKKWFVNINKSGTVTITWKHGMSMVLEFMVGKFMASEVHGC